MTWESTFTGLQDRLITQLKALKDTEGTVLFKEVYFGSKAVPTTFPCAIVLADVMPSRVASTSTSWIQFPFVVVCVAKDPGKTGYTDAVHRLFLVNEMLIADRSFGELCSNLEVDAITPDYQKPRVRDRHESRLRVTYGAVI
jgi:hypothetical protein